MKVHGWTFMTAIKKDPGGKGIPPGRAFLAGGD
jgi:hypothetical protein